MKMSIVDAVVYWHVLHVVVGLHKDNCWKLDDHTNKCLFTDGASSSRLIIECTRHDLRLDTVDTGNPFNENKHCIPRPHRLWEICMYNNGLSAAKDPYLSIDVKVSNNYIEIFPDAYFCNWPAISTLTIAKNSLSDTRKLGFSPLENCDTQYKTMLGLLDASGNYFEKVYSNTFCGLNNLTVLHLKHAQIKQLEVNAFNHLKLLQGLRLDDNDISILPTGVFKKQEDSLKYLYLANNRLDSRSIHELKNLRQLQVLDLSSNQIDVLTLGVFEGLSLLTHFNLENNPLTTLPGALFRLGNLNRFQLDGNNITFTYYDHGSCAVNDNTCYLRCPQSCKCYIASDEILIHIVCTSINNLPLIPTLKFNNSHELHVYLHNNSIYQINSTSFVGLNRTTVLYLDRNDLCEMEDGSFDDLSILKVLHLEYNNLSYISMSIFKRLNSLEQLFLSHNQLQTVADQAFPLQLQTLFVDNNQLVDFGVWNLENLTNATKLSLHGNNWSCECQYVEKFGNWLRNYSDIVENIDEIRVFCVQPNDTVPATNDSVLQMPLSNVNSSFCHNAMSINGIVVDYTNGWKWVLGLCLFALSSCHW